MEKLPPETERFVHDLRNCIASVRAAASMLKRAGTDVVTVEKVAQGLQGQVTEMLTLVDGFIGHAAPSLQMNQDMPALTPVNAPPGPGKILIADDNADAARTLATFLRLDGHRVVVSYDGQEALQLALADPPQAMLLDISMPSKDGYQLAREIRALPWGTAVKLIAISGWFSAEDRERARSAGFDESLSKPIDMDALQSLLRF